MGLVVSTYRKPQEFVLALTSKAPSCLGLESLEVSKVLVWLVGGGGNNFISYVCEIVAMIYEAFGDLDLLFDGKWDQK